MPIALFLAVSGMLTLACCSSVTPAERTSPTAIESEPVGAFTLTILGSGTPIPSRTQAGAAILVEVGGQTLLFDCGRGCTTRLAEYDPDLIPRIDKLFLSHLHSDHVVGIPDLWLTGWTLGRTEPLRIWGPKGVSGMMRGLRQAYEADLSYRDAGPGRPVPSGLEDASTVYATTPEIVYHAEGVTVTAFPVHHAQIPAYGFRIDYAGQTVMISGDTTITPNLIKYGHAADLVLLEVLSPAAVSYLERAFSPERAQAIRDLHLTAQQAGEVFQKTDPTLGVYYHTVASCETDISLLEQTRQAFERPVKVARDLMQIRLIGEGRVVTEYLSEDPGACE